MAIKIVSLKNATAVVGDEGKVTVTGEREEKGVLSAVTDIALMPTKINSDTTFVSESTAAVGSIAWGLFGFHLCDYLQADSAEDAISPLTAIVL